MREGFNWELRDSAVVHDNFIKVRSDTYTMPDGEVAEWEIIDSPDSVFVLALVDNGRSVVVFNQFRPGPGHILSELPGGYIDPHETCGSAGARELVEETGYATATLVDAGWEWADARSTRKKHALIGWDCWRERAPARDALETGSVDLVDSKTFVSLLISGALTDAGAASRAVIWASRLSADDGEINGAIGRWARSLLSEFERTR